jgi:hypothetical protein
MEDVKHWYLSKTIWGALIAMGASTLQFAGVHIGAGDQAALGDAAVSIAGAVGSLVAVYGRVTATTAIASR